MTTREQYRADPEKYRAYARKYYEEHKEERVLYARTHRKNAPEISRRSELKRAYGMSDSMYEELVEKQSNRCALCGGERVGPGKHWHVDHDHVTGKTRGLLCSRCNTALGLLHDDVELLRTAIKYLEGSKK